MEQHLVSNLIWPPIFIFPKCIFSQIIQHLHLPRKQSCPLSFLQQILANDKLVFKSTSIRKMRIPLWPELGIRRTWPSAIQHPDFKKYMPDTWTATRKTERKFFWTILSTLQTDFVEHLIKDCRKQRVESHVVKPIKVPKDLRIAPEWISALLGEPFTSCKQ